MLLLLPKCLRYIHSINALGSASIINWLSKDQSRVLSVVLSTGVSHTHTHACTHARTHTHPHTHARAHAHTRTRTHTHTCMHIHTHTHTVWHGRQTWSISRWGRSLGKTTQLSILRNISQTADTHWRMLPWAGQRNQESPTRKEQRRNGESEQRRLLCSALGDSTIVKLI